MANRRKKISTFGALAVIAGALAWTATRANVLGEGPVVIGAAGILLALLALLGSVLLGNTGRLLPLVGLAACVSAAGYGIVVNGHAGSAAAQFNHLLNRFKSPSAPPPTTAPSAVLNRPATPPPPPPPSSDDKPVGSGTIFDTSSQASHSTAVQETTPHAAPAIASPAIVTPPAATDQAQLLASATAEVTKAHAKVDSAMAGMLPPLSQTPAYQSAKTELDAAAAALKAARANGDPGNPELVAASQRYMDAKTALAKIVNQAAATDPTVVAAQRELIEAEGNLRALRPQQHH